MNVFCLLIEKKLKKLNLRGGNVGQMKPLQRKIESLALINDIYGIPSEAPNFDQSNFASILLQSYTSHKVFC